MNRQMKAAAAYIERGWKIFVVGRDKVPLANCSECGPGRCPGTHLCGHVGCHGFYSATDNLDYIKALLWRAGDGAYLALRTGSVSGVFVVDADADNDRYGQDGTEILDELERWAGAGTELPATLRAVTVSGGVHHFLQMPQAGGLDSKNRILPNVDLKADKGYAVLPPGNGRRWLNWSAKIEQPGDELLAWLRTRTSRAYSTGGGGGGSGSGGGVLAALRAADTIPSGSRYEFTRDLVYHLRRSGRDWEESVEICREYWERYEQPPTARWELPWSQVEYELERVWQRVSPAATPSFKMMSWAQGL